MPDRGPDREQVGSVGTPLHRDEGATDAGRTMGGGSLGHAPADDVTSETDVRNNPPGASPDAERLREREVGRGTGDMATGSGDDPVMPADDATLKSKI